MPGWLQFALAALLFVIGLRLSAFFSGTETGFYRLSLPRLSIDAQAGDGFAVDLIWFARNPAQFVATCLIGNNVANYITTAAIGMATAQVIGTGSQSSEILVTMLMAPFVFQFGELLPKSIYYLAPSTMLRRDMSWFRIFYRMFFVLSYPLVLLTRQFERLNRQDSQAAELVLGRSRLVQLMQHGHQEGVLTDVQSRLATGLLQLASQPVTDSMIPLSRILGVCETTGRDEMIEFARKFGLPVLPVHRHNQPEDWVGYVIVSQLSTRAESVVKNAMPVFEGKSSKLQTLHRLQCEEARYGVIKSEGRVVGLVSRTGLVEQIYRPTVAVILSHVS